MLCSSLCARSPVDGRRLMSDPWNAPEAQDWLHHVRTHVLPMVEDSNVCISLCPPTGEVDIKFAVELGMMIMLDKPIIVVADENRHIPDKLREVADRIFLGDITTPKGRARFMEMIQRFQDG
jgi:hypothetical protein